VKIIHSLTHIHMLNIWNHRYSPKASLWNRIPYKHYLCLLHCM